MSNVPKLRFNEFHGNWEQYQLGDVGKVSMCKRIFKEQTSSSAEIPFFKIGTFGKSPDAYIDKSLYEEFKAKYSYPKVGDILISASGTIGRTVVFDGAPSYFQDSNIVWLANDESLVTNRFLLHVYENTRWTTEDTTIARLYNDNLKKITFSAPSIIEQQKIAAFLTAVDTKIEQLTQKESLLKQYKKGVMQKIFSQEIRFKADDGSEFPEWENKVLGDLGSFTGGGTPSTSDESLWQGDIPWISSSDVYDSSVKAPVISRRITQKAMETSATKLTPKGSILFVSRVGVGKLAIAPCDLCTSQDFTNLKLTNHSNYFVANYFLTNKHALLRYSQGTSIKGFTTAELKKVPISIPCLNEQLKIASAISAIDTKLDLVSQQLESAEAFKKGLLQQMFV